MKAKATTITHIRREFEQPSLQCTPDRLGHSPEIVMIIIERAIAQVTKHAKQHGIRQHGTCQYYHW
jgi:ribosomal protein S15P/S13E